MGLSTFFKNLFGSAKETANELADKAEATFERENQAIPNIYVGKQNGSLIVSSSIVVKS